MHVEQEAATLFDFAKQPPIEGPHNQNHKNFKFDVPTSSEQFDQAILGAPNAEARKQITDAYVASGGTLEE